MSDPLGVPSPWVRRFAHLVPRDGMRVSSPGVAIL